jgi:mono/diheme cytochrome c family protein
MNKRSLVLCVGLGATICWMTGSLTAQSAKSTLDGIYNLEQAKRGRAAYSEHCLECHGRNLEGDVENRPLSGYEFTTNWAGGTLLTLFDRVRITMPGDKPGTLNRQTVADILSFVLQFNGYPAGKDELTTRSELLQEIKFDVPKL